MDSDKTTMWRVPLELVALVDEIAAEIAADAALLAEVGTRGGKPTRAGILRLLMTLGAKSLRATIREKKKSEAATAAALAVATKPASPPSKAGKGR